MKLILLAVLTLGTAWASEDKIAYPSFKIASAQFVFSDFQTANYSIKYDAETKRATYVAVIKLQTKETGRILFDIVVNPTNVTLDGKSITADVLTAPDGSTKMRATSVEAKAGAHELKVEGDLTRLVSFETDGVRSAYWLNDLYDRSYLENYVPSSFEYDRVKMTFSVEILKSDIEHTILTNGTVKTNAKNSFVVTYPEYYNTAAIFFHMVPKDRIHSVDFTIKSVDGRELPAKVYYPLAKGQTATAQATKMLNQFKATTEEHFANLESDFGKFLHNQILIYATDGGGFPGIAGMEYCGATMTNHGALTHELTHSYFGRGIFPANGNAGWLDEAITTWGTDDVFEPSSNSTRVSNPSSLYGQKTYARITHRGAYSLGATFMSEIAAKLKAKGDKPFVEFLADLVAKKPFTPYSNDDFWAWSKEFYGFSLLDLVPKPTQGLKAMPYTHQADKAHRRFSDAELKKLL